MSMDRTLKVAGGLAKVRSVLGRAERIAKMVEDGKFDMEKSSPLGLPKYKVRHSKAGQKVKKAAEEGAEGAAPAAGAAPAKGAAPAAAPAKGAAPAAKGAAAAPAAKGAAPAAKAAAPAAKKK